MLRSHAAVALFGLAAVEVWHDGDDLDSRGSRAFFLLLLQQ